MSGFRYIENVSTLSFDREKCTGCGMCIAVCPHAVFRISDGKAEIADFNACIECGACMKNCASGAISVRAGVGCAAGVISGFLRGTEPSCDCSDGSSSCCC